MSLYILGMWFVAQVVSIATQHFASHNNASQTTAAPQIWTVHWAVLWLIVHSLCSGSEHNTRACGRFCWWTVMLTTTNSRAMTMYWHSSTAQGQVLTQWLSQRLVHVQPSAMTRVQKALFLLSNLHPLIANEVKITETSEHHGGCRISYQSPIIGNRVSPEKNKNKINISVNPHLLLYWSG